MIQAGIPAYDIVQLWVIPAMVSVWQNTALCRRCYNRFHLVYGGTLGPQTCRSHFVVHAEVVHQLAHVTTCVAHLWEPMKAQQAIHKAILETFMVLGCLILYRGIHSHQPPPRAQMAE